MPGEGGALYAGRVATDRGEGGHFPVFFEWVAVDLLSEEFQYLVCAFLGFYLLGQSCYHYPYYFKYKIKSYFTIVSVAPKQTNQYNLYLLKVYTVKKLRRRIRIMFNAKNLN